MNADGTLIQKTRTLNAHGLRGGVAGGFVFAHTAGVTRGPAEMKPGVADERLCVGRPQRSQMGRGGEGGVDLFCAQQTASDDEVQVLTDLAGGAAESAVAAGCDDPIDQCV